MSRHLSVSLLIPVLGLPNCVTFGLAEPLPFSNTSRPEITGRNSMPRLWTTLLTLALAQSAAARRCTLPNVQYYADNGYTIAEIEPIRPFDFFFWSHNTKTNRTRILPIPGKGAVLRDAYDRGLADEHRMTKNSAFPKSFPVKIIVTTGSDRKIRRQENKPSM